MSERRMRAIVLAFTLTNGVREKSSIHMSTTKSSMFLNQVVELRYDDGIVIEILGAKSFGTKYAYGSVHPDIRKIICENAHRINDYDLEVEEHIELPTIDVVVGLVRIVDGDLQWQINVLDDGFYYLITAGQTMGIGHDIVMAILRHAVVKDVLEVSN
jgi:hypothetical protein